MLFFSKFQFLDGFPHVEHPPCAFGIYLRMPSFLFVFNMYTKKDITTVKFVFFLVY